MAKKYDPRTIQQIALENRESEEEKERRVIKEARNAEYYGMDKVMFRLNRESREGKIFRNLMGLIVSKENVQLAYRNLKGNKGSQTPGYDGKTIEDLEGYTVDELVLAVRMAFKRFEPEPGVRVEIPKLESDKMRALTILPIFRRLLEMCIVQVLDPIVDAKLYKHIYGFRAMRGAKDAIAYLMLMAQTNGYRYVVDVDIKGFFDNVDHSKLIKQIWALGIRDKKLIAIIKQMLKTPVILQDGTTEHPTKGTPQGGILSPLLANICLNEFDWWIAGQWAEFGITRLDGKPYSSQDSALRYLRKHTGLKEIYIVRYADDFKILTKSREEAEKVFHAVKMWLEERLRLEISPEKSGITDLRKGWTDFLGIRLRLIPKRRKWVVCSRMTDKAKNKAFAQLKEQVKKIQHSAGREEREHNIKMLNSMTMGMHNYYSIATMVSLDMSELAHKLMPAMKNRLFRGPMKQYKTGKVDPKTAIGRTYGKSRQLRFLNGIPVIPIGFCRYEPHTMVRDDFNRYDPNCLYKAHKWLKIDMTPINVYCSNNSGYMPIELANTARARYAGQFGRCAVTGLELTAGDIQCHHINPTGNGPPDHSYQNVALVTGEAHKLIHATKNETIQKHLKILNHKEKALDMLNKYRYLAGNESIPKSHFRGVQLTFF